MPNAYIWASCGDGRDAHCANEISADNTAVTYFSARFTCSIAVP
jgi:hypothetical protein